MDSKDQNRVLLTTFSVAMETNFDITEIFVLFIDKYVKVLRKTTISLRLKDVRQFY